VNVALTVKGKNSFKTFSDRKDEMAEKILSQYNATEQANFIGYLGKMATTIESMK